VRASCTAARERRKYSIASSNFSRASFGSASRASGEQPEPLGRSRHASAASSSRPRAGLAALAALDPALPRHTAAAAYMHERDGDTVTAARLYAEAARSAPTLPERDHLTRQAARAQRALRD
jgi:hypothetical protein